MGLVAVGRNTDRKNAVVSLFHVVRWGDDGQQQLFNSPLVIGQSSGHRGCLPLPPALPFLHPPRKRLERPREIVDPILPSARCRERIQLLGTYDSLIFTPRVLCSLIRSS